jgi:CubicO group peptidase (beta-lactamase class C family)
VIGLVVALILIRVGWLKWLTGLITLSIVAAVSLIVMLVMTNTSSVGVVMDEPPLPEIDAFLQDQGFSGAVLIAQDDQILLNKGYGYADRNRMTLNTPQARFPIGSVTKQFTAMAILMLQAEGKLNLQDPVCEYIADCPAAWREVTLYHLLTNSSGIPDFFVPCFSNSQDFEEAITEAVGQPLQFQPGEQYSYSNVGYHLLGEVIEQVSGQPYGEFLQRAIFTPLGMKDTGFEDEGYQTVGYVNAFLRACPFELSALGSEGGLYSTVEDMYRWDQALYTDQLIAQALLDEMFTAHVRMPDKFLGGELGYGYGWAVGQQFGRRMVMHGGLIYGFTSVIVRYPDDRLAVIILSNQQNYSGGTLTAGVLQRVAQEMLDEE